MTIWLAAAMAATGGLAASAGDPGLDGFDLAAYAARDDAGADDRRYLLPKVRDRYEAPRAKPRLRIRGRRLKLRVPIG